MAPQAALICIFLFYHNIKGNISKLQNLYTEVPKNPMLIDWRCPIVCREAHSMEHTIMMLLFLLRLLQLSNSFLSQRKLQKSNFTNINFRNFANFDIYVSNIFSKKAAQNNVKMSYFPRFFSF